MAYKWCAVPLCTNTTIKTPEKLFICVPQNGKMRKKWLQLACRDPNDIVDNSMLFFCEDHFNMETDMANYYQYKMGFSQRIKMVDGALPSKFDCQQDQRKRMCSDASASQLTNSKRKRLKVMQECENIQPTQEIMSEAPVTISISGVASIEPDSRRLAYFLKHMTGVSTPEEKVIQICSGFTKNIFDATPLIIQMVGGDVTETLYEETGQTANISVHCEQIASTSFQYPQASRKDDCSTNLPLKKQLTQTEITIQSNDLDRPLWTWQEPAEDQASLDHLEYIDSESTDSVETFIEAEPQESIQEDMVFCEEIPFAWCRLCGEEKRNYIDTKNKPYLSNKTILTVNYVSVELDFDDVTLSRNICHDCDRKLQEMFDFVKLVKDAQLKFNCDPLKAEIEDETDEITECKSTDDTNDKCDNNRNNKEEIPNVYRRVPVTNADFIKETLVPTKTKHDETKRADFVKTLVPIKPNDKTKRKRKHKTNAKTKDMITEREHCSISDINFGSDVSKKYGIAVDFESGKCSDDRTGYLKEALYGKITKITGPPTHSYKIVSDKCDGRAITDIDTVENIADDITNE